MKKMVQEMNIQKLINSDRLFFQTLKHPI